MEQSFTLQSLRHTDLRSRLDDAIVYSLTMVRMNFHYVFDIPAVEDVFVDSCFVLTFPWEVAS